LGPGSYTGIRSAIALAQGWSLVREVQLLGISSAECIAAQARAEGLFGPVRVVIDAQRNEFYVEHYEITAQKIHCTEPLRLATLQEVEQFAKSGEKIIGPELANVPGSQRMYPRAAALAALAMGRTDFVPAEKLEPIYLREVNFVKAPPPRAIH
jgi:tRNA threonylcarbamoyladenosine biosynthesis protein TsaB